MTLQLSREVVDPDAYPELIDLHDPEWVVVDEKQPSRLRRGWSAGISALLVAILGYGVYASGLGLSDASAFNAGNAGLASGCQTGAVTTKLITNYSPGEASTVASGVQVTQIDDTACAGQELNVLALDATQGTLGSATQAVTSGTSDYTVDFQSPYPDANLVESLAVLIGG